MSTICGLTPDALEAYTNVFVVEQPNVPVPKDQLERAFVVREWARSRGYIGRANTSAAEALRSLREELHGAMRGVKSVDVLMYRVDTLVAAAISANESKQG